MEYNGCDTTSLELDLAMVLGKCILFTPKTHLGGYTLRKGCGTEGFARLLRGFRLKG